MTTESANRVVLVINSGSSSLKYQLVDPDSGASRAVGIVEQIGEQSSSAHVDAGKHHVERDADLRKLPQTHQLLIRENPRRHKPNLRQADQPHQQPSQTPTTPARSPNWRIPREQGLMGFGPYRLFFARKLPEPPN